MKGAVSFLFFILVGSVYSGLNEDCVTPNNEKAKCISVYECKVFLSSLQNVTREQKQFLKASECGIGPKPYLDQLVCCGSIASRDMSQFTGKDSNSGKRKLSTSAPPTDVKAEIGTINKEKLALLPNRKKCGLSGLLSRVVGGEETNLDDYPWMALLFYKRNGIIEHLCGGSIINKRYVMTAAHCLYYCEKPNCELTAVRLGEHDTRTNPDSRKGQETNEPYQEFAIEEIIMHEDYKRGWKRNQNDIALLRLARDIDFSQYRYPICLPTEGERATSKDLLFVAGWGISDIRTRADSPVKMHVNLTISDNCEQEVKSYKDHISDTQLCAGGEKGKDSCNGDSGGPLMGLLPKSDRFYAEGIVSYGPNECGTENFPGVYTRVGAYIDWIVDHLNP